MKDKRFIIIVIILFLLLGGFYLYKGMGFDESRWDVHYENLSVTTVGYATYTEPVFEGTVLKNYTVSVRNPGDAVTYQFEIVNNGTSSAKLMSVVKSTPKCTNSHIPDEEVVCEDVSYQVLNEDGTDLKEGIIIMPNARKTVKIKVELPVSVTSIEDVVTISNLDVDLLFQKVH